MAFDQKRFISTLSRLMAHGERLQNSVDAGKIPEEILAANVVLERLEPYISNKVLSAELVTAEAHPKRPNLLITLKGRSDQTLSFVGAHFDVVPADKISEGWTTEPFQLTVDNDGTLRGRGVTDCLGHVALLTELLADVAQRNMVPQKTIQVLFISNEEESSVPGIGLDYFVQMRGLSTLTNGPLVWLDSADFGPTLGTGGIAAWELVATGVPGHSGMPQNCVNALELAMTAALELSSWFSAAYPLHPLEEKWKYASSSSMKTTIIEVDNRKVTKIPGEARLQGDIRMTPFYEIDEAVAKAATFVDELNERIHSRRPFDPMARFHTESGQEGRLAFLPKVHRTSGVACDLECATLQTLSQAIIDVRGTDQYRPWAMTGSLPLVAELKKLGAEVAITGFGRSSAYHAPNEFGTLRDFEDGYVVLERLVENLAFT
jgi:acetylornithine deacetylase/succinyl-diaminopimelate desuccinylase-like protein